MITGLTVTSAVCRKIHAAFPDVPICREHIGENYAEPLFFVWTSDVSVIPMQHPRFVMSHQIEVNYFPHHADLEMNEHLLGIGVSLLECLNCIEVGHHRRIVWGISPNYRIIDNNMLQFSVEYRIAAQIQEADAPTMETLETHINHK